MLPLSLCRAGETVRVVGIGGADAVKRHLGSLGFAAGALVRIVDDSPAGKIVGINDVRLAVNADLAARIQVEMAKERRKA